MTRSRLVMRKTVVLLVLCGIVSVCTSCAREQSVRLPVMEDYDSRTDQVAKMDLKLGVVVGPYGDMFVDTIEPSLSRKGYKVELVLYDNYNEPNFALANGEIDFNMFQHYKYLNDFKFRHDLNLAAIAELPTVPMGIYSQKYDSIDDVKDNDMVAIPGDGTNLARALMVLSEAELISLDPSVELSKVRIDDITTNAKNLRIIPSEAHLLTEMLDEYDLVVMNGNFAQSVGLSISEALFNEILTDHGYLNVIAVKNDDLGEPFVMDLLEVLRSEEFKNAIKDIDGRYREFLYPCNFKVNDNYGVGP